MFSVPTFLLLSFFHYVCVEMGMPLEPGSPLTVAYEPPLNTQLSPSLTTSIANSSSRLFHNTTSSFSYIISYDQGQECDIYGPICQAGSITVGVNLTTATTSTVVPCSSYLSSQSMYLENQNENLIASNPNTDWGEDDPGWLNSFDDYLFDYPDLRDWNINFGQSPECRSYAKALTQGQYTISGCGSSNTVFQTDGSINYNYSSLLPPGVVRDDQTTCCGNCSLEVPEMRLYYFPDQTATPCRDNKTSNITSLLSSHNLGRRVHSLVADGTTAVISGYTFTSPSIYLQLLGSATVADQCTTVGPILTNPIISLPPGGLSTWQPINQPSDLSLIYSIGGIWYDPKGGHIEEFIDFTEGIAPIDIKDLACPTWGLGLSTPDDGTLVTTIGPPYLPVVIPPMSIFSLDPIWASACTAMYTDPAGWTTLAVFDPPIALTAASLLLPTPTGHPIPAEPTTAARQVSPSIEPAKPAPIPINPVASPARTGDPLKAGPTDPEPPVIPAQSPGKDTPTRPGDPGEPSPPDPKAPVVPAQLPGKVSPARTGDSIKAGPTDSTPPNLPLPFPVEDPPVRMGDPGEVSPIDPKAPFVSSQLPWENTRATAGDPGKAGLTDPKPSVIPGSLPGEDPPAQRQSLGANIFDALGKSEPEADGSSPISRPQSIITIGTQTLTANPTGFAVDNVFLTPGGTPHKVDNTIISLGQSGVLAIGSSTIDLLPQSYTIGKDYAVAGHTFIPNPSTFSIAGTTISADGPAATVDGTIISLRPSGTLIIGSSTIPLLSQVSSDVNIDGFDIQAHSSFVVIDGSTLSAGAPGVTVSGTVVSLEAGGATLDIGTGRFALPASTSTGKTNSSINVQAFTGGQSKGRDMSLLLICGVCATLVLVI